MKAVVQRVTQASVSVDGEEVSRIGRGLLTLLGVSHNDTEAEMQWLIKKVVNLRIFEDEDGKMNRSLLDTGGEHLIVSQFTLFGDTAKGNRPSFIEAARPEVAKPLYERALAFSAQLGAQTQGGRFQAFMQVALVNDGPITLVLETPKSGST